ncbi:MAG: hypothetical protein ACP5U1_15275 [Desulfomonilaceae bacterium]
MRRQHRSDIRFVVEAASLRIICLRNKYPDSNHPMSCTEAAPTTDMVGYHASEGILVRPLMQTQTSGTGSFRGALWKNSFNSAIVLFPVSRGGLAVSPEQG